MQKIRKRVIVSLLAITALTSNTSIVNAQPFEMKKEIKYSIQHSDITEAEIKKEDIDEIVNKLPNLESESKIETLIEQEKRPSYLMKILLKWSSMENMVMVKKENKD